MRFFTGDESGLVKRVVFLPPPLEKKVSKKRSHQENDDAEDKKAKKKQEEEPLHEITVFGSLDKQAAVQKMGWATIKEERLLVVARQNGKVDFLHMETGQVVKSFKDEEIAQAQKDKAKTNNLRFIGLEITETHLLTCNSNGTLTWTPLDDDTVKELVVIASLDKTTTTGGSTIAGPGTDLCILRAHPIHRHLLAVAGKDIDVQIYDMNVILAAASAAAPQNTKDTAGGAPTPTPSKSTSTRTPKAHPRQKQKSGKVGLIYEAKNVKNDFLDLPQPVWVQDLQFVNENGTQVAVATHYHQIRLYDFNKARRPVLSVEIGKVPLTTLSVGMDFDHVVFTDTRNDVGLFNVRTGKIVAQLKGFAGAGKATLTVPIPTFTPSTESTTDDIKGHTLVSVALDRTLRLHELDSKFRKLEKKVYLKQRLTAVAVDMDYVVPEREPEEEDKEEEELWNTLETVKETKKPRLSRK